MSTWQTVDPVEPRTVDEVKQALLEESGFRKSVVDRGLRRLDSVVADGTGRWIVKGDPDLGDYFPFYSVTLDDGRYKCSCFKHEFGESRRHRICSHVIAVVAARRLHMVHHKPRSKRLQLTPRDLGLPAQFTEFRDVQLHALDRIRTSKRRFILLQGPTGSGKSLVAAAAQRMLNTRMIYVCFTKQLQDQFVSDFSVDLQGNRYAVDLKGRANYPTLRYPHLFPKVNASLCTGSKETHCRWCCDGNCGAPSGKCYAKLDCPYNVAKAAALGSEIAVLNFDIFVNEANYVGAFSKSFDMICIDEADLIEQGIMGFAEFSISQKWINRFGLSMPKKTVESSWIEWARDEALPAIEDELKRLKNAYGVEDTRREQELKRMESKIRFFLSEVSNHRWVYTDEGNRWTWKPVFVSHLTNKFVWRHANRFILMSATIISPDEMAYNLGIPREEIDFIDLPSTFPKERRPIYYIPVASISKKNERQTRPQVIRKLDEIIDKHPGEKVLVHTTSYGFASQVVSMSKHRSRMITYDTSDKRVAALAKFKDSRRPAVLVASSMERGVDLPDDLCRVVVILKVPFANLGDKQISQRLYSDKSGGQMWYAVNTIRTLVQETGRAMRSATDHCTSYILDGQFERLYRDWKYLFPKWWREALINGRNGNTVPTRVKTAAEVSQM
ncbi:MAG: helicase C-terminal domain-containing protein [Candidatus Thorarchaeota archaeon]